MAKLRRITYNLLDKSNEAFLLALELYNKPTIKYRVEAFSIFYSNAWELLLKAKVIEDSRDTRAIYRNAKSSETIGLDECLRKIFTDGNNPIRKNIETVSELRNQAVHLIIPELETIYSGVFQSGILNYISCLDKWFSKNINITPSMMTLVFDYNPNELTKITIDNRYGKEVGSFFDACQRKIIRDLRKYGNNYGIAVNTKLALVSNPNKADGVLATGSAGNGIIFIDKAREFWQTHPYKSNSDYVNTSTGEVVKSVVQLVQDAGVQNFNQYLLSAIKDVENINQKTKPNYIYKDAVSSSSGPYHSKEFVDYIIEKIKKSDKYLDSVKERYRKRRK